jgi:hypothetical protein
LPDYNDRVVVAEVSEHGTVGFDIGKIAKSHKLGVSEVDVL